MITSISNSKVKNIIQLTKKAKARREQGVFIVEGIRMAQEAPEHMLKEVYISKSFSQKKQNEAFINKIEMQKDVFLETVSDDVFSKMSDTVTPQGVICVVTRPEYDFESLMHKESGTYLLLEDIQDPGNLGTMVRTGEGAGVSGIIVSRGCTDLFNPKTIRSTMGSIYRVPVLSVEDLPQTILNMKKRGVTFFAAHLEGAKWYDAMDYSGKCAFMIGNEGNGLTNETTDLADERIKIPMEGQVESLNAAISATILMYEAYRQKRK